MYDKTPNRKESKMRTKEEIQAKIDESENLLIELEESTSVEPLVMEGFINGLKWALGQVN